MQLHELQPVNKGKTKKRVGRGGKRGTYSGRGMKGQKARSGTRFQPIVRELLKRYHKLRGFGKGEFPNTRRAVALPVLVNLAALNGVFMAGETVTPETLVEKNVIRKQKGRIPKVKLLGTGELDKKLAVERCFVSGSAKEKIEKAGGSVAAI